MFRTALTAALLLAASPLLAAPQTPISFELSNVDADTFRITNRSPSADIVDLWLRPGALATLTFVKSVPDIDLIRRPSDATEHHFTAVGGFDPGRWVEFTGPRVDPSMLEVRFAEFHPSGSQFGHVLAPELVNGQWSGLTIPEPSTIALGCVALASLAWAYRRRANRRTDTTPT